MQRKSFVTGLVRPLLCGAMLVSAVASATAGPVTTVSTPGAVSKIGLQGGGVPYFVFANLPSTCAWNLIFIDSNYSSDSVAINRAVALLTAAYMSNKSLTRVDYVQDTTTHVCSAVLVEF